MYDATWLICQRAVERRRDPVVGVSKKPPTISAMRVRRVVTGHDAGGKAVVASDTEVDGIRP
ncbi:MAG TPA: hypothetical protein VFV63_13440, partial [Ilumatobacteraceae bacterium]|nr:hypothetical protein [Ilumatobacteraceae bacterium]